MAASLGRALVDLLVLAVDLEPDAAVLLLRHAPAVGDLVDEEQAPAGIRGRVGDGVALLEAGAVVHDLDAHARAADVHVEPDRLLGADAGVLDAVGDEL